MSILEPGRTSGRRSFLEGDFQWVLSSWHGHLQIDFQQTFHLDILATLKVASTLEPGRVSGRRAAGTAGAWSSCSAPASRATPVYHFIVLLFYYCLYYSRCCETKPMRLKYVPALEQRATPGIPLTSRPTTLQTVQCFRGGLVCEAHRFLYQRTRGSRTF